MLPQEKLDLILRRHAEISDRLAAGPESAVFVALSRELAEIDDVVAVIRDYRVAQKDIAGVEAILTDT
ncbi:MAG: peptide chain release factor 1, partial [Methylovirgula sp.]